MIVYIILLGFSLFSQNESPLPIDAYSTQGYDIKELSERGMLDTAPVFTDLICPFDIELLDDEDNPSSTRIKDYYEYVNKGLSDDYLSFFTGPVVREEWCKNKKPGIDNSYSFGLLLKKGGFSAVVDYRFLYVTKDMPIFERSHIGVDAERAMLQYDTGFGVLQFGRDRQSWGNTRTGNLVISREAYPMDKIRYQVLFGDFYFDTFHAQLASDTLLTTEHRYLGGHKLGYRPNETFEVALSELIIYGGQNRNIEWWYLIPILAYNISQRNEPEHEGWDDNTFLSLDASYLLSDKGRVYGTFFIDDLQIDKKKPGDYEPNELGYVLGIETYNNLGLKGLDANAEWVRVNNWTYNQNRRRNVYINKRKPIGSPFGNDFWYIDCLLSYQPNSKYKVHSGYRYMAHGEGRIDAPWTEPWMKQTDYYEPFPSGIVEKSSRIGLGLTYYAWSFASLMLEGGAYKYKNLDNKNDKNETLPFIRLELQSQYIFKRFGL